MKTLLKGILTLLKTRIKVKILIIVRIIAKRKVDEE